MSARPIRVRSCNECGEEYSYFTRGTVPTLCGQCRKAATLKRRRDWDHRQRLKKWGLTEDEYERLSSAGCPVCGETEPGAYPSGRKKWVFDHDHRCGACGGDDGCPECFRGLLCSPCNTGLGKFDDDPELLRLALEYVKAFPEAPRR